MLTSQNKDGKSRFVDVISFSIALLKPSEVNSAIVDVAILNDDGLLAKCFLETKNYEHALWEPLIQRMKEKLLISNSDNIDEKWLADLHIFNVVAKDAEMISKSVNMRHEVNLTEYYKSLVINNRSVIYQILGAFAKQDAVAVFRICELTQFSLLNDFPQIIIDNCDQQPFLGLVKDKILNDKEQYLSWISVLTKSALQKQLVARMLYDMPANSHLAAKINSMKCPNLAFGKESANTFLFQCYSLCAKKDGKRILLEQNAFKTLTWLDKYFIRKAYSKRSSKKILFSLFSEYRKPIRNASKIAIVGAASALMFIYYYSSHSENISITKKLDFFKSNSVLGDVLALLLGYLSPISSELFSKYQRSRVNLYLKELNLK